MTEPRKERKFVTVVFADLVGFTTRAETLDPEDVEAILRPYHERLRTELERHGGTVEKFIGDAVMAVFGAPVAHEDDPERAIRAALAIRDWALDDGAVDVRIAVNTGEALVSLDARPESGEAMVAGDVVNTAARMQSAAPVNGVLVGETTRRATAGVVEFREAEPIIAKGKAEPVRAWEALAARSRFGVDIFHGGAPLFGRERELALITDAFARARAQREPQLVTLVGVPGIGKSRLVFELMEIAAADPDRIRWRQGRCLPYGEGVTFWALGEVVKSHAGIFETDDSSAAYEKLHDSVAAAIRDEGDARWVEEELRPLVGVATETETEAGQDRENRAVSAWIRFVEALADDIPLVLVLEDLHWADEKLLDFVDELVDRAADVSLLVVATARPELLERRPDWGGGKANALTLSLAPLEDDDTARLLSALLDRAVLPADTQEVVLARAEGNPLFAEQFAQMLVQHPNASELPVPESVHGIIAARLDSLPRDEKTLLQDASVHGKVFWAGAIASAQQSTLDRVGELLHALERKQFLRRHRRSSVAGETEYAFRHALLRDVAYGQIPRAIKADKHRVAAEWIDSLAGDRDDHVELLADHYVRALELARAAGTPTTELETGARLALRSAGARASSLNAHAAAKRLLDDALELWPEGDEELPQLLALRARALHFLAEDDASEALEQACAALLAAGDREEAAELEALLAELWWHRGDGDRQFAHLYRARELVEAAPTSRAKARVISQHARFLALAGRAAEALAAGEAALAMGEELDNAEICAHALNNIGIAKHNLGDTEGALAATQRAVELALAVNSPDAGRAYNNLASVLSTMGDFDAARAAKRESRRVAERFGDQQMIRFRLAEDILEWFIQGEWDRVLEEIDRLLPEFAAREGDYAETGLLNHRAVIRSYRGDDEGALEDAERSLAGARRMFDPQRLAPAIATAIGVNLNAGRVAEARALALEAVTEHRGQSGSESAVLFWLAIAADELQLQSETAELLAELPDTAQAATARALQAGDWETALAFFEPDFGLPAALTRLLAAKRLLAAGRRSEADKFLRGAIAFATKAGATRMLREADALLRESA